MKLLPNTVKYRNYDCVIGISRYNSDPDRIAIVANDFQDGSPVTSFTKNIPEYPLAEDEVIFDINNCGLDGQLALMDAGILGPVLRTCPCGFVDYPVHKLLIEL